MKKLGLVLMALIFTVSLSGCSNFKCLKKEPLPEPPPPVKVEAPKPAPAPVPVPAPKPKQDRN
jgi:hypothetical protein